MPFTVTPTSLPGVLQLQPKVYEDARGFFLESFNARDFEAATGLRREFVQDNHSGSMHGVLRGMHYQRHHPQGKLVRAIRGEVFDVAVDMRRGSSHFGQWTGVVLSAENKTQLWIPEGFAHGFLVLSETAEFAYKTTDYWHPQDEQTLLWNDVSVAIAWPHTDDIVIAEKDRRGKPLAEAVLYDDLV